MVIDNIKNAVKYYGLGEKIETALKWIQNQDFSRIPVGRIDIDGDNIYAGISEYNTRKKEDGFWEAHKKYIDVQYVASGSEIMGWANIEDMKVSSDYDNAKDFYKLDGNGSFIEAPVGTFAIFYPNDAHMPNIILHHSEKVKKIVVKVRV